MEQFAADVPAIQGGVNLRFEMAITSRNPDHLEIVRRPREKRLHPRREVNCTADLDTTCEHTGDCVEQPVWTLRR